MTSAELAVIAALGASALTGAVSLGVVGLQEHLRSRRSDRDVLAAAVTAMLARSMEVSLRAQAMGDEAKIRSGILEGVDIVILRLRKPFSARPGAPRYAAADRTPGVGSSEESPAPGELDPLLRAPRASGRIDKGVELSRQLVPPCVLDRIRAPWITTDPWGLVGTTEALPRATHR
jgi:hypothetical protein